MKVQITCSACGSSIEVKPSVQANTAQCQVCHHETEVFFNSEHEDSLLHDCPVCKRKDFYQQKDFNRKIGVVLFVIAAILVPWTYGLSLVVLYLMDVFLFKKIGNIASCYKCNTIFRDVKNLPEISPFDHEMNDRIVYSDHDYKGERREI